MDARIPVLKVPSTATVNAAVVPTAVKQNSKSVCSNFGRKTVTLSDMLVFVLFSSVMDERQC